MKAASPLPLALLRIGVAAIVLVSPEPAMARAIAARPPALWFAPEGLGWYPPVFASLAPHLGLVHTLLRASAVLVIGGIVTRASLTLLLVTTIVLFGGAQLSGTVLHDMHLVWLLLVLLVSPCDDALSLDAWARGRPMWAAAPSVSAAIALTAARALLGLVYLFPGIHKCFTGSASWVFGDNLRNQMRFKWYEAGGVVPWPRVDLVPAMCVLGAASVVLFELTFGLLASTRRGRPAALASGLAFHALAKHFMHIAFPSLWVTYVVLLDGERLGVGAAVPARPSRAWPVAIMGLALTMAVAVAGARGQTDAWPFACYPTFAHPAPDHIKDLAVDVHMPDGSSVTLRDAQNRPQDAWGTAWRLLGLYGHPVSTSSLDAFAVALAERRGAGAAVANAPTLDYVEEAYSIDPARYGEAPITRRLIATTRRPP